MKAQVFVQAQLWSAKHKAAWAVSAAIRSASKGAFSHIGILFTASPNEIARIAKLLPDNAADRLRRISPSTHDGKVRFYYESIATKTNGKTGPTGPHPFLKKAIWHLQGLTKRRGKTKNSRRLEIADLHLTQDQIERMIILATQATQDIKYAHLQIGFNWLGYRLGRGIPLRRRSRRKYTCCEFIMRLLGWVASTYTNHNLGLGDFLYDEYSPSGTRGIGVWELITSK